MDVLQQLSESTENKKPLHLRIADAIVRIAELNEQLQPQHIGDSWIRVSLGEMLNRLVAARTILESDDFLFSGFRQVHPLCKEGAWSGRIIAPMVDDAVTRWRSNLDTSELSSFSISELKGIFDYYFKYDLYGDLKNASTLILSGGTRQLPFFTPPAGVRFALDIANRNNWFGYSDSLGHVESRIAIAALERERRKSQLLEVENVALVQGGTHGLHVVMGLLRQMGVVGRMLCVRPNYAPLIDDISNFFELEAVPLTHDYLLPVDQLIKSLSNPEVCGLVLSFPHNPPLACALTVADVVRIADYCAASSKYLIIDEVAYTPALNELFRGEQSKKLVLITSYSKRFAVPGLKLGHLVAHASFIEALYGFASSSYGSPPSFHYLAVTTINGLELQRLTGQPCYVPEQLIPHLSHASLLIAEYESWSEVESIYDQLIDSVLEMLCSSRFVPSVRRVYSAEPGSINRVISPKSIKGSYQIFLDALRFKDVSVFPMDCMVPIAGSSDVRITTQVPPTELVRGVTALYEILDEMFARDYPEQWIAPAVFDLLMNFGCLKDKTELGWVGHSFRVVCRIRQLITMLQLPMPEHLVIAAALHDLGKSWARMNSTERTSNWERLFRGRPCPVLEDDDRRWGRALLDEISDLRGDFSHEGNIFHTLSEYFESDLEGEKIKVGTFLIDLADKTSDFIGENELDWADLYKALFLKRQQLQNRYSGTFARVEREIGCALRRLEFLEMHKGVVDLEDFISL